MPEFDVRYLDRTVIATRRVTAADAQAVAASLGVAPGLIVEARPVAAAQAGPAAAGQGGVARGARRFPLRLFSQELAVLLGAGLPLLEAISTLREKEQSATVRATLNTVADRLQAGESLSAGLAARPEAFDALFVAVVSSAERSGQLQGALRSHAVYLAWVDDLRAKLIGASIYPLVLVVAGFSVLVFLLVFVVPRFAGLLEGMSGEMPAASRALIELGHLTGTHPLLTLGVAFSMLAAPVLAWQQPAVRAALGRWSWRVPVLGDKLRLLALARLYRTIGMLLGAGVPLVPALRIARAVSAPLLLDALDAVTQAVSRGERLSIAIEREGLSTPVSVRMVRVGERSGELGAMLGQASAFYDEELSRLTDVVTRLVNPLLMLVMGAVIGSVIVLMYLPIFQLVEQVQ